jgi:hypothetical protein
MILVIYGCSLLVNKYHSLLLDHPVVCFLALHLVSLLSLAREVLGPLLLVLLSLTLLHLWPFNILDQMIDDILVVLKLVELLLLEVN